MCPLFDAQSNIRIMNPFSLSELSDHSSCTDDDEIGVAIKFQGDAGALSGMVAATMLEFGDIPYWL